MKTVTDTISIEELKTMANKMFGNLVKAVVDVDKGFLVVDADLHADQEEYLLKQGSNQQDLWGINLHPDKSIDEMVEFDSMINLRPNHGNNSRGVDDPEIQQQIIKLINAKITP